MSAALAMSRLGFRVRVLERTPSSAVDGGGGLGVDVALLQEVTGIKDTVPVSRGVDRDSAAWHLLEQWLEDHARAHPAIDVQRGATVVDGAAGSITTSAHVVLADGEHVSADLVIGADGSRSTMRRVLDPANPDAHYAGVLLWRCLVDEAVLGDDVVLPQLGEPAREVYAGPYRLVTYPIPGAHGETTVGHRRLNIAWYDPEQGELLVDSGLLAGDVVHGSLAPGALPALIRDRLADFAAASWPRPWRDALRYAFAADDVFGTPVVHYLPRRMAHGRLALAGDAAHSSSPMVGGGFRQGLYDVASLTTCLTGRPDTVLALQNYQAARLGDAQNHVRRSQQVTEDYLQTAGRSGHTQR